MTKAPVTLLWLRRDLCLSEHPALTAACAQGGVIPVFIRDNLVDGLGSAPKFRLNLLLEHLSIRLAQVGSRLILRSGPALVALSDLIQETGADAVFWSRNFDPVLVARDTVVKSRAEITGYLGAQLWRLAFVRTAHGAERAGRAVLCLFTLLAGGTKPPFRGAPAGTTHDPRPTC